MRVILTSIGLALIIAACDELPRDPQHTLTEARSEGMRVGLIESPPWASHTEKAASGVEVELVEKLADQLGTDVTWIRGGESELMPALERFELHLVIGGIARDTPWKQRVGLSRPYFTERFVVGVRPGRELQDIAGERVAVREGSPLAAMAKGRGADVVPVPDLYALDLDVVIASAWQLELLGRESAGTELHRRRHVMAVPPGENRWLLHLDRFLHREATNLPEQLRQAEAPL